MKEIILLKYGELVLKGLNRSTFVALVEKNVRKKLKEVEGEFTLEYSQSTMCITPSDDADIDTAFQKMLTVFGVVSVCRGYKCEKDINQVLEAVREHAYELVGGKKTFKCNAKRSDKKFPLKSPEISALCGEVILEEVGGIKVDVNNPEVIVTAEIRDTAAYVHGNGVRGAGGMPTGSSGRALLLLSGGIDSPVAGYMIAKRGVTVDGLYFDSPPYTSELAMEKVTSLARRIKDYTGSMFLNAISVTEIQEEIMKNCEDRMLTLLLRRFMMRIADRVAKEFGQQALITGESLGQVASQTLEALTVTNAVPTLPVLRPCIGMDKVEITDIARKIGTFETSILPYEDCCTVFTPTHPLTRPTLEQIEAEEQKLDVEGLIERAMETRRVIKL